MFITVTCPKCGREIKAKKRFVLSTGCVPCLKCKVRIPLSKEQVEAYSGREAVAEEAPEGVPEAAPVSEESLPAQVAPAPAPEPEPAPVPVPEPEPDPLPVPGPEPVIAAEDSENDDTITPAIAAGSEPESPAAEAAPPTGSQITFTCPNCQMAYPMRQTLAGKKIRCKGCSRIVKVAAGSPVIPGPEPVPPPLPPPPDDDIPVIFSPVGAPVAGPAPALSKSAPIATPQPAPEAGPAHETIARLRKALAEAEERANSADTGGRGTLKRSEVENLLKTLCEALDANLKQDISAHQNLVDDLKKQLIQALQ